MVENVLCGIWDLCNKNREYDYVFPFWITGTGLNAKRQPVLIETSLGGNILETDEVLPGEITTTFDNKLIWAASRSSVKRLVVFKPYLFYVFLFLQILCSLHRMRDENQPIKLQCFSISPKKEREAIGFVLVQIRGIVFSLGRKPEKVNFHTEQSKIKSILTYV